MQTIFFRANHILRVFRQFPMAGVLDESYSQLTPLSGVAVQARQST
jgi:hypothetical protein